MEAKPKILVVDDHKTNLALLRLQLKEYEIKEAQTSGEAMKHFANWQPDLVIMDMLMPGMDGFSLLSVLRKSAKEDRTPIITLTALDAVEDKVRCLDLGADVYLAKPFAVAELKAMIRSLLRSHEYTGELLSLKDLTLNLAVRLEEDDRYFAGHSQRVAGYAYELVRATTPLKADREQVRMAALLHDIGKFSVNNGIYHKEGSLSEEDWDIIKAHPVRGGKILSEYSGFSTIVSYVKHHHEHWDGSGYPEGLTKLAIPTGARIIGIADAYDAMLHGRAYRAALTPEAAIAELEKGKETFWDPKLCDTFIGLFHEGKLATIV